MGRNRRRLGDLAVTLAKRTLDRPRVAHVVFDRLWSGQLTLDDTDRVRFLAFCAAHQSSAHGQLLQDLWVRFETDDLRDGYFVEFGAFDGVTHSSTYGLERSFDWHGIVAEPNPAMEPLLRQNRTCSVDMRAVWTESASHLELLVVADPELSTLSHLTVDDHHSDERASDRSTVSVETVTLEDLLTAHDAPRDIDFLSVDTEGSELDILRTFDFSKRRIRLVAVEHNFRTSEAALDTLMMNHGYERRFRELSSFDAWYRLCD